MNTGDRSSTLIREDNRNTLTDLPGSRPAKVVGPTEESKDFEANMRFARRVG